MFDSSTPHARYRLYTSRYSYRPPWFENKNAVVELEEKVCNLFEVENAVCVPMARTGLFLVLSEVIKPGQTIVMSPLTIVDVVNAVVLAGGVPAFADIDRASCAMSPETAESRIDTRTGAVLLTHLHGETAGAYRFLEICRRRGVPLIEDASQAFGAVENQQRLGTIGDAGIYSFGFYKNISAWSGGMVVAKDPTLIQKIRQRVMLMRKLSRFQWTAKSAAGLLIAAATWPPIFSHLIHPLTRFIDAYLDPERSAHRLHQMPDDYFRAMRPAQGMLCLNQLHRVDIDSAHRIERAHHYHEALHGRPELITPRGHEGLSHIFTHYPLQCEQRDDLLRYARTRNRDFSRQYLRNCADLAEFSEFHSNCPNARAASRELVLLPTYPEYPITEVRKNIAVLLEFLQERIPA